MGKLFQFRFKFRVFKPDHRLLSILLIDLDTQPPAVQLFSTVTSGIAAGKGVEHQVALIR